MKKTKGIEVIKANECRPKPEAEAWRRVWGGQKHFSRTKISFSHRPGFSDFPFLFPDFPYLYCVKCRISPFFTRKTTILEKNSLMTLFFTLFVLSRASDNTTSQNIGGGGCMDRPPTSNFFGGTVPPVPPRSPPL